MQLTLWQSDVCSAHTTSVSYALSHGSVPLPAGSVAFKMFQQEMMVLLNELKSRGAPDADDQDISTQLYRVLQEHPDIPEARVLSEIGILFVEGFETTGHTTSWTLFNIASVPGE